MLQRSMSSWVAAKRFAGLAALMGTMGFSLLTGCGVGALQTGAVPVEGTGNSTMAGILHGGPNPIVGATITLYTTTSSGYGATANTVASTTTGSDGGFTLTLPTNKAACPTGEFAYLGAYSGSTGSTGNNPNALLMVPIGLCDTNYTSVNNSGVYTNTYTGGSLWVDELTTIVSAYTLGSFTTVGAGGVINIGAPANNHGTSSSTSPSAAGLAHAFANALSIINTSTGQPYGYTHNAAGQASGAVIPDGEIFLLGNILQACVNSTGVTGTNTATGNDGSLCGKLFSLVTPPQSGAAVPTNTLQAMLDLAKYPNPLLNTWNAGCTAAGGGTSTATSCLFGLATSVGAYTGALTSAPPDWTLALVYKSGYGAVTSGCASTCPGLTYPMYVALDYQDNVYVLNYSGSNGTYPNTSTAWTNIVGMSYAGTSLFSTAEDTTNKALNTIATDTAGHIIAPNTTSTNPSNVVVYNSTSGAVTTTLSYDNTAPIFAIADPFNNVYVATNTSGVNLREFPYSGGTYSAVAHVTVTGPAYGIYQMVIDSNLDIYEFEAGTTPTFYAVYNKNAATTTAGSYTSLSAPSSTVTITGNTNNGGGIIATSSNGAYVVDSVGVTAVTKGGTQTAPTFTAGSPTALPTVYNSTLYNRYASADGNNWVYTVDSASGSAVSGVDVYDSVDNLALGTYKGCYVISGACGTTAGSAPMYSPRGAAIDSSGDIWVASGASADLTELIGAAAPTWPGLSMAKAGLPQ